MCREEYQEIEVSFTPLKHLKAKRFSNIADVFGQLIAVYTITDGHGDLFHSEME